MAEINQYTLPHQELLELLIRHLDVHEGVWSLIINIGVGAGNFGPSPEQLSPGLTVVFTHAGIQRVLPGTPILAGSIYADAAKVNPALEK